MAEMLQQPQQRVGSPGGWSDPFAPADVENMVHVQSGAGFHEEYLPVAGMTVGEVSRRYADRMNLAPDMQAFIDGRPASEDTILQAGTQLYFARRAAEKG